MNEATEVLISGHWPVKVPPHRAGIAWDVWEKERLEHMWAHIKQGDIIFDIGSEEGDLSACYALWGALVIPFEPDPYVWPNFRFTWERNGFSPPPAYWVGFAANETILNPPDIEPAFRLPARDGWPGCAYGPLIDNHGFRNETERFNDTPKIRIDDFCSFKGIYPDLITIDVEGAEVEVLKGARDVLLAYRPLVYVSIHPEFIEDKYSYRRRAAFDLMFDLNYDTEFIIYDHESHWFFWPKGGVR